MGGPQRAEQAQAELVDLGVPAVSQGGAVWPCVFSRWLPIGNVLDDELAVILDSPQADVVRAELAAAFAGRAPSACRPDSPRWTASIRPAWPNSAPDTPRGDRGG